MFYSISISIKHTYPNNLFLGMQIDTTDERSLQVRVLIDDLNLQVENEIIKITELKGKIRYQKDEAAKRKPRNPAPTQRSDEAGDPGGLGDADDPVKQLEEAERAQDNRSCTQSYLFSLALKIQHECC